ncbi:hypothetical protein [Marinifilum flexuosum]|uniref:hypothetical protein n=1 Tax=Marinifilum flexuosum TaxID=1117708 RepID=UPI00248FDD2C|nr:hypothetical protein [Marinifilum flexuosum]
MNTLNKILITCFLLSGVTTLKAQKQNFDVRPGNQVCITNVLGTIKVEEYDGNGISIETNYEKRIPARAKGLKPIYGSGLEDNTNLGINSTKEGKTITLTGLGRETKNKNYYFKIPKGVSLKIDCKSPFASSNPIVVRNFSSEIEINTLMPSVKLDKVTGPVILDLINGSVDIVFSKLDQKSPVSISAINGNVDITMPSDTPANIELGTINGEFYTDFDIKVDEKEKKGLSYVGGGNKIKAQINGGGVNFKVKTINNNIYLRKK